MRAINSLQPHKSPGPDGLHPHFYQHYWPEVRESVLQFCHQVFEQQFIPPDINTTHICLILKNQTAFCLCHYRPISLCNTIYKIITKIIVNRIKPFLSKIIGPTQSSFQLNRRATDNTIIVQELLNHFHNLKSKRGQDIIKLDLEKAFDRLK